MRNKPFHIVVVSDPPAKPGFLPRLRYLCDYLVRKGYRVTLVTEEYQPLDFAHTYPIRTIRMYNGSTLEWLLKSVWTLLTDWHNRVFARRALRVMETKDGDDRCDLVLCTAFSDFPLGAARRMADRWQVPLLCDIRDLDEQVEDSRYQYKHQSRWLMPFRRLYRAVHIRRRNEVLRTADAVTTVSPWHAEFIRPMNANVHLVYNGYDAGQFYPEDVQTDRFCILYIGSLFDWQQPALQAVEQAIRQTGLPVTLEMHTPQQHPVPHNELGDAIRRSGMMLVLTHPCTHGMLTTKFFEALGCAKPVLCVPSDEGALAELIRYTRAGIATGKTEEITAFITEQYRLWQQHGYTRQHTEHREEFSREYQCEQLERLIHTYDD